MRWTVALERVRRDIRMLRERVSGVRRPVFTSYPREATALDKDARSMRVASVVELTPDAVSIRLEDIAGAPVEFLPGQFLTLLVPIDGHIYRRAYSICSPSSDRAGVTIAVKRVLGGVVSTWLCERTRVGETFAVLGPSGSFTVDLDPDRARTLVLVAGGSGITPILSIARSVLEAEPKARIVLVFANRGAGDVMFRADIGELASAHPGRLFVQHVLESPAGAGELCGQLTGENLAAALEIVPIDVADATWYVCGPEPMMAAVRAELWARGVDPERIRQERFASPSAATAGPETHHEVRVHAAGRVYQLSASSRSTVLEAAVAAGVPLPYSCTVGGCGSCRVRLIAGHVDMDGPNCLLEREREAGYVLACVARPCASLEIEIEPGGDR